MRRKLLNLVLAAVCGAVWLYKCHMAPVEWGYLAACLVSYLCLTLIPQRLAALIAVTAVTVGMSVFFPHYLYCYAPVFFACAALFTALSGKQNRSLLNDGVLFAALGLSGVASAVSLRESLVVQKTVLFMRVQLERYHIYAILFTVFVAFLAADSLRLYFKNRKTAQQKKSPHIKLCAVYVIMLVSFTAAAVLYLKDTSTGKMSLLPIFIGTFAAITEGIRVYTEKRAQPAPDGAALNNTPKKRRMNT